MRSIRGILATLLAVFVVSFAAPVANASECEPPEPGCQPCGEKINAITQKLYGDDLITCPW